MDIVVYGCGIPGQCTVLQGSCSSLSPSQVESRCVWLKVASVWLQLRKRRLIPTSSTWLKHVLLHSDQLVHFFHTPSGTATQEEDSEQISHRQLDTGLGLYLKEGLTLFITSLSDRLHYTL